VDKESSTLPERLVNVQFDLYAFISVLMRGAAEASDILQETNLTIMKNGANFDLSRPFLPWARGVARKCVLKFYSARCHDKLVVFDNAMIERLAELVPCAEDDQPLAELSRLRKCISLLVPKQREVVTARYLRGEAVKDIASRTNCSEGSVSVLLHRIRQLLADCVTKERRQMGVSV
jgi:RNA polymerase sigma-70 factor (ECF subfamily)